MTSRVFYFLTFLPFYLKEEKKDEFDLKKYCVPQFLVLVQRISNLVGLNLSSECLKDLGRIGGSGFSFMEPDVVDLSVQISHSNISEYSDGMALNYEGFSFF